MKNEQPNRIFEMDVEAQARLMECINSDFNGIKNMLAIIQERISTYPVYTQLEFVKPILHMVVEAFQDATNPDDSFLNNYDGGDRVVVKD